MERIPWLSMVQSSNCHIKSAQVKTLFAFRHAVPTDRSVRCSWAQMTTVTALSLRQVLRTAPWPKALQLLVSVWCLRLEPDLVSCSMVLRGTNWQVAFNVFSWMMQSEVLPDLVCTSHVLTALTKGGPWQSSGQILRNLRYRRQSSAISSLDRLSWPLALSQLYALEFTRGITASYNAAMGVTGWRVALYLAEDLRHQGNSLDTISYNSMINNCKDDVDAHRWCKALQLLMTLESHCRASAVQLSVDVPVG
eukprot:Skav218445  [mRNA]  locus=scaffold905:96890:105828:+ [translate_table: standard]